MRAEEPCFALVLACLIWQVRAEEPCFALVLDDSVFGDFVEAIPDFARRVKAQTNLNNATEAIVNATGFVKPTASPDDTGACWD